MVVDAGYWRWSDLSNCHSMLSEFANVLCVLQDHVNSIRRQWELHGVVADVLSTGVEYVYDLQPATRRPIFTLALLIQSAEHSTFGLAH